MTRRIVGKLFGKNVLKCRENELKRNEYRVITENGEIKKVVDKRNNVILRTPSLNLLDIVAEDGFHGEDVVKVAESLYDGVNSVTYKKPLLEEKTFTVTDTSLAIIISPTEGKDGMSEITLVFDLLEEVNTSE